MAERRMIWRRLSNSRKVNRLSIKAALLWTWAIPWFDVKGYLEVEPDLIKDQILPRRKDIDEDEIPALVEEIFKSGLWTEFECDGKRVAFDPKFKNMQTVREDHETKSLFDGRVKLRHTKDIPTTDQLQTNDGENKIKGSEVKGSEIKANNDNPENGAFYEKLQEAKKYEPTCKEIEKLCIVLKAKGVWQKAPVWARMKLQLQNHPEAILHTLQKVNEYKPKVPESYAEQILSVEDGNYNEAEHIAKSNEFKKGPQTIGECLKNAMSRSMQDMPENQK